MNSPTLPEKNESFTPLSLDQLMKLKEEVFLDLQKEEDETYQWMYLWCIARYSLDDAREMCCRLWSNTKDCFFSSVVHDDALREKYSDILTPLFAHDPQLAWMNRDYYDPDGDTPNNTIWWPLKKKIDLYYSQFIARKKINSLHMKYPDSQNQYELETLLEQMLHTNQYDLAWVNSSLALALSSALYVKKDTGKEVFLAHGEASVKKSRDYLVDKITKSLPYGCELVGWDTEPYTVSTQEGIISPSLKNPDVYTLDAEYQVLWEMEGNKWKITKHTKHDSGLWLVNDQWEVIVNCVRDNITNMDGYFCLVDKTTLEVVNWNGTTVMLYDRSNVSSVRHLWDGIFLVKDFHGKCFLKRAWMASQEWITEKSFGNAEHLNFSLICVTDKTTRLKGAINRDGEMVLPMSYKLILETDDEGYLIAYEQNNSRVIFNSNGSLTCCGDREFKNMAYLGHDLFAIKNTEEKRWMVNAKGVYDVSFVYDNIQKTIHPDLFEATVDGKKWILNDEWTLVIWCEHNSIYPLWDNQFAMIDSDRRCIVNNAGGSRNGRGKRVDFDTIVERFVYDWNALFKVGAHTDRGITHGLINSKGEVILDCKYVDISVEDGYIIYRLVNDTYEMIYRAINIKTQAHIHWEYHGLRAFSPNLLVGYNESDKWFTLLSSEGKKYDGIVYDSIVKWLDDNDDEIIICQLWNTFTHYKLDSFWATPEIVKDDVEILNLISNHHTHPQLCADHYLHEDWPNQEYRRWKHNITTLDAEPITNISPLISVVIQKDIEVHPENYLEKLTAKPPSKELGATIRSVLYPETHGYGNWMEYGDANAGMYYRSKFASMGWIDTDNSAKADLSFERPVSYFVATGILWSYQQGVWTSLESPYITYALGELKQNSWTIWITNQNPHTIALPTQTNSCEIEKVEIQDATWKRTEVDFEIQTEGIPTVDLPALTTHVRYHFSNTLLEEPLPSNITHVWYEKRLTSYLAGKKNPFEYQYRLPQECEIFLDEIKKLPPKERVIECESFVRQYMRYDTENYNAHEKSWKPLEQQVEMCMQHKSYLLQQHPELSKELGERLFVGVCEDASNLLYLLLCRTGILSWKLIGYAGRSGDRWAHARNYVLLPDYAWNAQLYEIDGTPNNCTRQSASIEQKEIQIQKQIEQLELQGVTLHKLQKNIESTESVKSREQKRLNDLEKTITQLIDMYHTNQKDELIAAAIEQKINQLPESLQSERWEKYKQSKAA